MPQPIVGQIKVTQEVEWTLMDFSRLNLNSVSNGYKSNIFKFQENGFYLKIIGKNERNTYSVFLHDTATDNLSVFATLYIKLADGTLVHGAKDAVNRHVVSFIDYLSVDLLTTRKHEILQNDSLTLVIRIEDRKKNLMKRKLKEVVNKEAFVTCATNDSYGLGALILGNSLREVNTSKQLAVIITSHVSNKIRSLLESLYDFVQIVDILKSDDEINLALLKRPDLGVTFTKFHCWRLTQFNKCVFLDADTLVLKNCDELFEKEEFSACPDVGWPDCFNSGVFVFKPNEDTYKEIVKFSVQYGSFDGGDQGVLNVFFNDWRTTDISKHLSFIYNMNANAGYFYQPAYKQFGKDVKIVHFLGAKKPWMYSYDSETGKVQSDSANCDEHLQLWWNIFMKFVQPYLTIECKGVAGDLSKNHLGGSGSKLAQNSEARRFAWEHGKIDYMGVDAWANIQKKLETAIAEKK